MTAQFRILVADSISEQGIGILQEQPGFEIDVRVGLDERALIDIIHQYHALLIRSATTVTKSVIEAASNLKVIGRAGIGVDNIDLKAARLADIVVMNTPHGNAIATAEHTIGLLFALARHIPYAHASLANGRWDKSQFKGIELCGKTFGIMGLGNIGRLVAERAHGLKMRVIAHDPFVDADRAEESNVTLVAFDSLLEQSDFISLHLKLNADTNHLFNKMIFEKMKNSALLLHVARGGIVDESALLSAIEHGEIAGAGLDVFENEPLDMQSKLRNHPRIVATPHLGASTREAQSRVSSQIARQVAQFLTTGLAENQIE